jgi:hypothetical protein
MVTTAKIVQVSDDSGVTWKTLPGGSGDWNDEAGQINDTIFGHTFQSNQTGLITWTANANAIYKGFAGYVAKLKKSGTSTTFTTEAMSLVSGKTYEIADATKDVWDRSVVPSVYADAVLVNASNIESIDYLFGRVTFISTYTPAGAVTVSGKYLPMAEISKINSFTLTQTAAIIDKTDFALARTTGYRSFDPGLRTVGLQTGGFYDVTNDLVDILDAREEIVSEINPDGSGLSMARGFVKMASRTQSGDVGALEAETANFGLTVPENIDTVFAWRHDSSTTLSEAIQIVLNGWLNETPIMVRYLPDGVGSVGFSGECVVTDVSLSSSLDAMNVFAAKFQGSGEPTRGTAS